MLTGGRRVPCDAVVIGIGVAPALDWLQRQRAAGGRDPRRRGRPLGAAWRLCGRRRGPSLLPAARRSTSAASTGRPRPVRARLRRKAMLGLAAGARRPDQLLERPVRGPDPVPGSHEGADRVEIEGAMEARDFVAVWSRGRQRQSRRSWSAGRAPWPEMRRRLTRAATQAPLRAPACRAGGGLRMSRNRGKGDDHEVHTGDRRVRLPGPWRLRRDGAARVPGGRCRRGDRRGRSQSFSSRSRRPAPPERSRWSTATPASSSTRSGAGQP